MTIKTEIQRIASDFTENFLYGRNADINISADSASFPAIVMIEPDSLGLYFNSVAGTVKKSSTVFIRFLDIYRDNIAEFAEDRLSIIDAMSDLSVQFVNALINDSQLEVIVGNTTDFRIPAIAVIDAYDAHCCGVEIQLNVRLTYPEVVCP